MDKILFQNARVFSPTTVFEPGWLLVEGRSIAALGNDSPPAAILADAIQVIDAQGLDLLPGFIDMHVHGALDHDVMDASQDGLQAIARHLAQHGVTSFLAATWTAPDAEISRALEAIRKVYGQIAGGATPIGAYLEGPHLNPDPPGAQAQRQIRPDAD